MFADVLFHGDGDNLTHGSPLIEGATVTGEVVEQRKDKKVIAFKYRRRKGYHRTVGHRRKLTRVKITEISLGSSSSKSKKTGQTGGFGLISWLIKRDKAALRTAGTASANVSA